MLVKEIEKFREKLKIGNVYGPFSKTMDPGFIEVMGSAGFDFVILDMEHGPCGIQTIQNLMRATQISDIFPIARVKERNHSDIGEVLDIGAAEIKILMRIMSLAKSAPKGSRGGCRFARASSYSSMDRFEYLKKSNEAIIIIQLEGKEDICNLDEILNIEWSDIIFVEPYDLSQSLVIAGQIDHPRVERMMWDLINKCNRKGVYTGTFVDNMKTDNKWKSIGVKHIAYSVDRGFFYDHRIYIADILKLSDISSRPFYIWNGRHLIASAILGGISCDIKKSSMYYSCCICALQ